MAKLDNAKLIEENQLITNELCEAQRLMNALTEQIEEQEVVIQNYFELCKAIFPI